MNEGAKKRGAIGNDRRVQELEAELASVKAQLRAAVERYETPTEEPLTTKTNRAAGIEALRERERFIQQVVELTPVVLDVFDLQTEHHTYFSSDVVNLFGYTRDEIAGMEDQFSVLTHPEDLPRLRENIAKLKELADGEINEFECRVRRRNGQWRWMLTRSMVFTRGERGEARQVVNATFDATERKEASEKLRESEERFRSTFELGLVGMAITSPTKGIVEVNDEFCKILGYERDELLKRTWAEMTHPDDLAADIAQFNRVMAGEIDGYKLGKRFIRKDGRIIDTTISVKALRRADGSVDYFVALLEDITESKRFETLLGAQKRALEMVVGGSPLAEVLAYLASIVERQSANSSIASLMLLDDQGRLHNGAAPSLPEDFIQALDGIEADEGVGTCSRAAATGEVVITPDIAADPQWQDFKHLPLGLGLQSAWSMPIVAADGRVLGTFGTYFREKREPTGFERQTVEILCGTAALAIQRKRAEEALQRAHDELERRVAERTQELTVTVATLREEEERRKELLRRIVFAQEDERRRIARDLHDQFGQQLNVMILHLGMLKEACGDQPKVSEQIAALEANANQLDSDIDFLVHQLRPTALDDLGLQAALTKHAKSWSRHSGVHTEFHAVGMEKDRLTPETETALYRIVQEALNNVAKHARAGHVVILLERRSDSVSLIVEDDGVGFDQQKVQDAGKGNGGFGLIGMRERAALVGGTLVIESHPGKGVSVFVRIPAPPAPDGGERS
ncbi:MAG TPA: PAS domain S-box protein [Pyrinomonadaceae bacterium]|nr:PAS domain S-box protein [Pyrinomonadaceae bacterium]